MKWYFALNAASIEHDDMYATCVRAAVLSALQNTQLQPCFLFDGPPCALTGWVQRMGGSVIFHRSSLSDAIVQAYPRNPGSRNIAHGAFLRLDIPDLDHDSEFVIYTDCDVLFLQDPPVASIHPTFFAVAPEFTRGDYSQMNSGVMVMNLPGMRCVRDDLHHFIRDGLPDFQAFDQGALRLFFEGRFGHLPETLNWKPYWGRNDDASIIHFHGPKPFHAGLAMSGQAASLPQVYQDLFAADPANYARLVAVWQSYVARAALLA